MKTVSSGVVACCLSLACLTHAPDAAFGQGSRSPTTPAAGGGLPTITPTLELNARWGGQPLDAFFHISANGRPVKAGRTSISDTTKIELATGTYRIVVEDDGAVNQPKVVFDDVQIQAGNVVRKTADFEEGTLKLAATTNGSPLDGYYEIFLPGDNGARLAKGRTALPDSTLRLTPGSYRIVVEDDAAADHPIIVFDDVEIQAGSVVQKTANFEEGVLKLAATANGDPLDAYYEVFLPGEDGARVAQGRTGAAEATLRLSTDNYRIVVEDDAAADHPLVIFEDVRVNTGGTTAKTAAFDEGTFTLKATLNGSPVAAYFETFTTEDDPWRLDGRWAGPSGASVRLSTDSYRIVAQVLVVEDHPKIAFDPVQIEAGQEVQETAAFTSGTLELKATLDGRPLPALFRVFAPGAQGALVSAGGIPEVGTTLQFTPGRYRIAVLNQAAPNFPDQTFDVNLAAGLTVSKTAEFSRGTNLVAGAGGTPPATNDTAMADDSASTNATAAAQPDGTPTAEPARDGALAGNGRTNSEGQINVTVNVGMEKTAESREVAGSSATRDTRPDGDRSASANGEATNLHQQASQAGNEASRNGAGGDASHSSGGTRTTGPIPERDPASVVLLGNHQFAWESGTQALANVSGADLCWKFVSTKEQYLVPLHGARMAVVTGHGDKPIELLGSLCTSLPARAYSGAPIRGGTAAKPGVKIAMITGEGDGALLEIAGFRSSHDVSFPEAKALGAEGKRLLLRPEEPNYHLQIRGLWRRSVVTWNPRESAILKGNMAWDAESNESGSCSNKMDFWWEQVSATERYLVPINGTRAALVTNVEFEAIDAAFVQAQPMSDRVRTRSKGKKMISDFPGSDTNSVLQPGTVLVFRTAEGAWGKLIVDGYRSSHDFSFPGAESLSPTWKESVLKSPTVARYHMQVRMVLFRPDQPPAHSAAGSDKSRPVRRR